MKTTKRIISLILTVMMLVSMITVGMVSASAAEEIPTRTIYVSVTADVVYDFMNVYTEGPSTSPMIVSAYKASYTDEIKVWTEELNADGSAVFGMKVPTYDFATYELVIEDQPLGIANERDIHFVIPDGYNLIEYYVVDGMLEYSYGAYTPVDKDTRTIYFYVSDDISGQFENPITSLTDCVTGETFEVELIEDQTSGTYYSAEVPTYSNGMSALLRITNGVEWTFTIPAGSNFAELSSDGNYYSYFPELRTIYISATADVFEDYMCAYTEGPSNSPMIVYPSNTYYPCDIKVWTEDIKADGTVVFGIEAPTYDGGNTIDMVIEDQPVGIANARDLYFMVPAEYDFIEYSVVDGALEYNFGTYTSDEKDTRKIYFFVDAVAGTQFGNPITTLADCITGETYTVDLVSSTNDGNLYSVELPAFENGTTALVNITNGRDCKFSIPSEYNYAKIEGMTLDITYDTCEEESRTVYFYLSATAASVFGSPLKVVDKETGIKYTTTKVEETSGGVLYAAYVKTDVDGSVDFYVSNGPGVNVSFGPDDNYAYIGSDGSGYFYVVNSWATDRLRPVYFYVDSVAHKHFAYPIATLYVTDYGTVDTNVVWATDSGTLYSVMLPTNEDGSTVKASVTSGRNWSFSIPYNSNCASVETGSLTTSYVNYYDVVFDNSTSEFYDIIRYNASGTVPFTNPVKENESCTFGIAPAAGYVIDKVEINGEVVEADPLYAGYSGKSQYYTIENVTNSLDVVVTVKEIQTQKYNVTVNSNIMNAFTVIGDAEVAEGADYTLELEMSKGYVIDKLIVNTNEIANNGTNTYTIENVTEDLYIFVEVYAVNEVTYGGDVEKYLLVSYPDGTGVSAPAGRCFYVNQLEDYSFGILPSSGYKIDKVTVNGQEINPLRDDYGFDCAHFYTVEEVMGDLNIEVTITEAICEVTFQDWDGTILDTQTIACGEAAIAPADPVREGYTFRGWNKDFSSVEDDLVVKALYDQATGTIRIDVVGGTGFKIAFNSGTERPQGLTYYNAKAPKKAEVTVIATGTEDNFIGWVDPSNGQILSTKTEYKFTVLGNNTYKAIYAHDVEKVSMVTFFNKEAGEYGQYWDMQFYAAGEEINYPNILPRYGYEFAGWKTDPDSKVRMDQALVDEYIKEKVAAGNNNISVYAHWERVKVYIDVNIVGGYISVPGHPEIIDTVNGKYIIGSGVTVKANTAEDGKEFAYWMDQNGVVRSYEEEYKFYPTADTTMTAVFVAKDVTVEKQVLVSVDTFEVTEPYGTFTMSWYVPDAYECVDSGLIAVNKDNYDEAYFAHGSGRDNIEYDKTLSTATASGTKGWLGPVMSGQTWYAKAWVQYKDADGNLQIVYSDMFEVTKD